jgi:signal transduction histidine kinase
MISPDNFPYFLSLFSLGIFAGTYLLFAYYIDRLLVLNTTVLYLSALRVASEFYIQQLETYEQVVRYAPWHILPVTLLIPIQWSIVYLYVRPLRGWKWERWGNNLFIFGLVVIPFLGHHYFSSIDPQIFYFNPEKIGGYWQFGIHTDFWYYPFYRIQTSLSFGLVLVTLVVGVIRNKRNKFRQFLLLVSYLLASVVYFKMTTHEQWNIPTTGILYVTHAMLISWYLSNYRLFKSNFSLISKNLFESISDLTISTTPQLDITHYNSHTAALFDMSTKNLQDWLLRTSLTDRKEEVAVAVNNLKDARIGKVELSMEDRFGEARTFDLKMSSFMNGDRLLGYTFLLTDLSEIRKKERELAALNAGKDRLFAIVAHDLRKPALSFRGVGKKINYLIGKNDFARLQSFGTSLEGAAFSLNSLLDNLLGWASQQRNMLPYNPQQIALAELTQEALNYVKDQAADKKIDLQVTIPPGTSVYADPNAVLTIVRNLSSNAVKFTEREGAITISARASGANVVLLVSDNGIGISPDALSTLFDLSKQSKKDGTEGEKGTGLGLHLVKELVAINQGSITVESPSGRGTTFSVTLPASKPSAVRGC